MNRLYGPGKIIIFILAINLSAISQSTRLVWPCESGHVINSTLGEYRSGHFHMGLDFKTWGTEGYAVYAIADGWISRIKTSPYGYGKALYLRIDDGRTVVYAHLSHYSRRILPFLKRQQLNIGRYSVDVYPGRNRIRVHQGEVIAWSGSTGNGQPHLHFELRDANSTALNPLNHGYTVRDMYRPVLEALTVSPLDSTALLNGEYFPQIHKFNYRSNGRYELADTLYCMGSFGFAAAITDRADGAANKFAPYIIKFFVDDSLYFAKCYDKISFSDTHLVDWDYDYWMKKNGWPGVHKLYCDPENSLPIYTARRGRFTSNDISVNNEMDYLSPGLHSLRIECSDHNGNTSIGHACLVVGQKQCKPEIISGIAGERSDSLKVHWQWQLYGKSIHFNLETNAALAQPPAVKLDMLGWSPHVIQLKKRSACAWTGQFFWHNFPDQVVIMTLEYVDKNWETNFISDTLSIAMISPETGGIINSLDAFCSVEFPPETITQSIIAACRRVTLDSMAATINSAYQFYPTDIYLQRPVKLQFDINAVVPDDKLGIGAVSADASNWIAPWPGSSSAGMSVRALRCFTLIDDYLPPEIHSVWPGHGAVIRQRRPLIVVTFVDSVSGIGSEDDFSIIVNGEPLIVEWIPHHDRLIARPFKPFSSGTQVMDIWIRDRAGNALHRHIEFKIVD
ncbi:M23 family metallopeptidase [bacterium]|nr:M23 family metallopeptidase [bacterium]